MFYCHEFTEASRQAFEGVHLAVHNKGNIYLYEGIFNNA